jgi:VCBS repeat-containing protein
MAFTLTPSATVTLTSVDATKLPGAAEDTYFGISYSTFKVAANENAAADAFVIVDDRLTNNYISNLYVNTGTTLAPVYVSLTSFVDNNTLTPGNDPITLRSGGIFVGNVKVSNADNKIYWLPPENESGSLLNAFTVLAADNITGVWGNGDDRVSTTPVTVQINVAAVNDAPVIDVTTDSVSLNEDSSLVFSVDSVSDVDDSVLSVNVAVTNGQLDLLNTDGLTFSDADGEDGTLSFSGSAEDIEAALNSLQYSPDENFNGTDALQISVTDGEATDNATININVDAVNDAPVNNVPLSTIFIDGNATDTHMFTDVSVSDVDAGSGNVTVSLSVDNGSLELGSTDGLTFADADGSDGTLEFTGSLEAVNAALFGLTYTGDEGDSERVLTITTSDNGNTGAPGALIDTDTINISLNANMSPILGADFASVSDNGLTGEDGNSVSGNILSNDFDIESDAFFITQVSAGDSDSADTFGEDGFNVQGEFGEISVQQDGSYVYTVEDDALALGETVTDTFTYEVMDSNGNYSTTDIVVTVTGANDGPVANDDFAAVSDDGETYSNGNSVSGNVLTGESGFNGWDVNTNSDGDAFVASIYGGGDNADLDFAYESPLGGGFLVLEGGQEDVYTTASRTFSLAENGTETISGVAAFPYEDEGFPDSAYVRVYDAENNLIDTVFYAESDNVGWTNWSFTTDVAGDYRIEFGAANGGDDDVPSSALFDIDGPAGDFGLGADYDVDNGDTLTVTGVSGAYGEDDIQVEAIVGSDNGFGKITATYVNESQEYTDVGVVSYGNDTDSEDQWNYVDGAWEALGSTSNLDQFFFGNTDDAFVSAASATDGETFFFDTTWEFDGQNGNAFAFSFAVSSELDYDALQFLHSTDGVNYNLVFSTSDLFSEYFSQFQSGTETGLNYSATDINSLVEFDDSGFFGEDQGNINLNYELNGVGQDDDLLTGNYFGEYAQGTHYFRWAYVKDGSETYGNDAAYVSAILSFEVIENILQPVNGEGAYVDGNFGYLIMSSDGSYEYTVTNESLDDGETFTESFTYEVTDSNGATDLATLYVTVNGANDAPDAFSDSNSVSDDGITNSDGNTTFGNVLSNDSDVDTSDELTVLGVAFGFDSENGVAVDSDGETVYGNYGYLTMESDGDYSYTVTDDSLAQGEVVTEAFGYIVTDGDAQDSNALFVTVNGTNDGPQAYSDNVSVSDNGITDSDGATVSANVLSNDTDVDNGAELNVASVEGNIVDSDGITVYGNYGYLTIDSDGSYSYTVTDETIDDGFVATENFDYVVSDEFGATDASNLYITVNGTNDAPEAFSDNNTVSDDGITYDFGNSVSGNVLANDTDVDANDILYVAGVDNLNDSDIGVMADSDGVFVAGNYGYLTIDSDGDYSYTVTDDSLAQGEVVTEAFGYVVTDGDATDSNALYITVTGTNDAPEGFSDNVSVSDNGITDSDGITVYGNYGYLTIDSDGSYSYTVTDETIDDGFVATENFDYVVSDEFGATDASNLYITVNGTNDAPDASDTYASLEEDDSTVSGNVLVNTSDVDTGDVVELDGGARTAFGQYGFVAFASDGSYTYTVTDQSLAADEFYTESFSYVVTDGDASDTATLFITVNGDNDTPEAFSDNVSVADNGITDSDGDTVTGNLLGNDTDVDASDELSVTLVNGSPVDSDGITINGNYGYLTIESDGDYSYTVTDETIDDGFVATENFSYVITDDFGATDGSNLYITVNGTNDAPDASDTYASVDEDDVTVIGNVVLNATDVDAGDVVVFDGGARTAFGQYGFVAFASDGSYTYTVTDESLGVGDFYTESFSYVVTDGDDSDTGTLFITVNGDNDAPSLSFDNTDLSVEQGQAYNLFDGTDGLISISDTDVNDQITVNVFVTNGVLSFADSDLNVTGDIDGSDGELEFTGSIADVNNALANLVYTGSVQADDTLVVIANDDSGTDNDTVVGAIDITVNAPDDTFEYAFNSDGDVTIDMDAITGDYSNVVISGSSAKELLVQDLGEDVALTYTESDETLTLLNTDYSILDGSTVSFADGSVLVANTGAATTLLGTVFDDQLISGNLGDTLRGLDGNDLLIGGNAKDRLQGDDGNDILYGGNGSDVLFGGADGDFFVYKTTGSGTDILMTAADNGKVDTIYDFTNGEDLILLSDGSMFGSSSFSEMLNNSVMLSDTDYNDLVMEKNVQGGVQLTFDGGAKILLLGVTAEDIDQNDFYFASGIV